MKSSQRIKVLSKFPQRGESSEIGTFFAVLQFIWVVRTRNFQRSILENSLKPFNPHPEGLNVTKIIRN